FLFEVLDLVVKLVHLLLDFFLLQHAFAHQQSGQAVEEDVVLDDHLLELLVLVVGAVVAVDVVHAALLRCSEGGITKWHNGCVGHAFGWGILLQIAAIIHWSRKRPATYWLFIIIFFGFLGALAYFLVEGIDFESMGRTIKGPSRRRRIRELQVLVR